MEPVLRMARKQAESLLARPEVVGVGIGSFLGEPRIVISVIGLSADRLVVEALPPYINDVQTSVVITGPFVALQDRTDSSRLDGRGVRA